MFKRLLLAWILLLIPVTTFAYSGSGGVWVQRYGPKGFIAQNFPGTYAGFIDAFNAAADGGIVNIGAGRYSIPNTLNITGSGIQVFCQSDSTVFEDTSASGDTLFHFTGEDITWNGGTFDGKGKSGGAGLCFVGARNVDIHGARFNSLGQGIDTDSTSYFFKIHDNWFTQCSLGFDAQAESSMYYSNYLANCINGIHIRDGGNWCSIFNNIVVGGNIGLYFELVGAGTWGLTVYNNVVKTGSENLHLESQLWDSGNITISNNTFFGNSSSLSTVRMVTVSSGSFENVTITKNRIYASSRSGIQYVNGSGASSVLKNIVISENHIDSATQDGIEIPAADQPSTITIARNIIKNVGGQSRNLSSGNWTYTLDPDIQSAVLNTSLASAATIAPFNGSSFLVSGTTTITDLTIGADFIGKIVIFEFTTAVQVTNGNHWHINTNFNANGTGNEDLLVGFIDNNRNFIEISRTIL